MPSLTRPEIPHYHVPDVTKENLDYADLVVVDLSQAETAEGRAALASLVKDAMTTHGFFYVVNHGYTRTQTERMFDIADVPFAGVDPTEMQKYTANIKATGSYEGYKPRQYWHIDGGVRDQVEHYNMHRDVYHRAQPSALRPLLPEIASFAKHCHTHVMNGVLRFMAIGLGLSEDALADIHGYDSRGNSYVRFMKYHPRTAEDEEKTSNVWLKGHTDFGSITILYSQPISALQILSPDGKWRWIKHMDNALVINAGDCLEFLTGGIYKATIHRVVQPPADQRGRTRLGLFYFGMPNDDVTLVPLVGSERRWADADAPTVEAWRRARTSAYGQTELKKADGNVEEEVINGAVVKHYS